MLPSVIDTPANRAGQPDADFSRWVTPAKIAQSLHRTAAAVWELAELDDDIDRRARTTTAGDVFWYPWRGRPR